jgi:hypothetical protein
VISPRVHYGIGAPFLVQVSFPAVVHSFGEDDVYFAVGRGAVVNVTAASSTSYADDFTG